MKICKELDNDLSSILWFGKALYLYDADASVFFTTNAWPAADRQLKPTDELTKNSKQNLK